MFKERIQKTSYSKQQVIIRQTDNLCVKKKKFLIEMKIKNNFFHTMALKMPISRLL